MRGVIADAVDLPRRMTVAEWAGEYRRVSAESGSRFPGKWRHDRTPHLIEIMEAMSADDPCEDVWIMKSAQVGVSEAMLNAWGADVHLDAGPCMYVLPNKAEAEKFNRIKLQPFIDSTPEIAGLIMPESVKGQSGSTNNFKKYPGGFLIIGQAHASATLNMATIKRLFNDEVTDWPLEAGERGDPLEQAVARTTTYEGAGAKRVSGSTPGIDGHCRMQAGWESSDKRRLYTPCPECGEHFVLAPEQLRWQRDTQPHGAYFECPANGCVIEREALYGMMNANGGRLWICTYEDAQDPEGNPAPPAILSPAEFKEWRKRDRRGRPKGFHVWQAQSLIATWDGIVASLLGAKEPRQRKKHRQQVEGRPYVEKGEAPDSEKLYLGREARMLPSVPRDMPVLTGALDVQGNRLEWAVYAWGPGMRSALVDFDVIEGETDTWKPWLAFDAVIERRFPIEGVSDHPGLKVARWALDAGHRAQRVYEFARRRGGSLYGRLQPIMGGNEDAKLAQRAPILSAARPVKYDWEGKPVKQGVDRRDLGTWPLKVMLYEGLRQTLAGPDDTGRWPEASIRFGEKCTLEFFEQITAEALVTEADRSGRQRLKWVPRRARNEQLDLWCYARAMAEMLELPTMSDRWWREEAKRLGMAGGTRQPDLFGHAAAGGREASGEGASLPTPEAAPESAGGSGEAGAPPVARQRRADGRPPAAAPSPGDDYLGDTSGFWGD
ncbi:MAG: terminase gpA endonuclease subunit [Pseudomonadota bacterium]